MKVNTIITHSGTFHTDEVFACALLTIFFENKNEFFNIIRTRDEVLFPTADILLDVGGIYDEKIERYDHHQKGGAGLRENGIPYATFGLVWKKYAVEMYGQEVAMEIDKYLVAPIDAADSAYNISIPIYDGVREYFLGNAIYSFNPTWNETELINNVSDEYFMNALNFAKAIILREVRATKDMLHAKKEIMKIYNEAENKKIIVINKNYPWKNILVHFEEPLFVIYPGTGGYKIEGVQASFGSFERRKYLPKSWAGLRDDELAEVTGVPDAFFCHNGLFLAGAKSFEGVMALAELALKD